MRNKIFVIIAASGYSSRFNNSEKPKQFCYVDNDIIIRKVVNLFLDIDDISKIICVIPENFLDLYNKVFENVKSEKLMRPIFGGKTRQESVKLGLDEISKYGPDYVLIHDAARCFCDKNTIENVLNSLKNNKIAAVPAVSVVDSVRLKQKNINRNDIKLIQTPQGFDFKTIYNLHKKYESQEFNDDSALCDLENIDIDIVEGSINNKKITYSSDLNQNINKIGFGFDAHKFSANKDLFLMGVKIEDHLGLDGHSDADVGIHSLVDAILGALGLGSIGEHFPSSDLKWKNANSQIFLEYCKNKLQELNYIIVNIDSTIVCESPNISKYSKIMKKRIANILEIDEQLINIKGKTTEGMGFTGNKEGISAFSTILIKQQ